MKPRAMITYIKEESNYTKNFFKILVTKIKNQMTEKKSNVTFHITFAFLEFQFKT